MKIQHLINQNCSSIYNPTRYLDFFKIVYMTLACLFDLSQSGYMQSCIKLIDLQGSLRILSLKTKHCTYPRRDFQLMTFARWIFIDYSLPVYLSLNAQIPYYRNFAIIVCRLIGIERFCFIIKEFIFVLPELRMKARRREIDK